MSKLIGAWLQALPPAEVADEILATRAFAARLTGGALRIDKAGPPHVTLVFLGDVEEHQLDPLGEAIRGACARMDAMRFDAESFGVFEPSDASNGKIPAFLGMGNHTPTRRGRTALRDAVAPWISAPQFPSWHPHVTLGFLPPGSDSGSLLALDPPTFGWTSIQVHLAAKGERTIGRWELGGVAMSDDTARALRVGDAVRCVNARTDDPYDIVTYREGDLAEVLAVQAAAGPRAGLDGALLDVRTSYGHLVRGVSEKRWERVGYTNVGAGR